MIDRPTDDEKTLIWNALVHAIESNSGIGFSQNADQGHPVYADGAKGKINPYAVDTRATSAMFKLLASFDRMYHEEFQDLSTWEKFCSFAVESHRRAKCPSGG